MNLAVKRIAVVGTGRMGAIRCQTAAKLPNVSIQYVVDQDINQARAFCDVFGGTPHQTLEEVIESGVDAVWLATPTAAHFNQIHVLAENRIPIGVEKPVALTSTDIEACYRICQENEVPLHCCFQRRTDSSYGLLRDRVHARECGELQCLNFQFRDHPVPSLEIMQTFGDLFYDCGVHDFDYLRWVTDAEVTSVYATGKSSLPELQELGILDVCKAILHMDNGVIAYLDVSRTSPYGYDQTCEAFCLDGTLSVTNPKEHLVVSRNRSGIAESAYAFSFPQRYQVAFDEDFRQFVEMIDGTRKTTVSCKDSCRASQIAEACSLSARKQMPVTLVYDENNDGNCEYVAQGERTPLAD